MNVFSLRHAWIACFRQSHFHICSRCKPQRALWTCCTQSHKDCDEATSLSVRCDHSWNCCMKQCARLQMVLTQAARGLIHGDAGASSEAEEADDLGRIAALLCFDEMQITDVFTAVALKGVCLFYQHLQIYLLRRRVGIYAGIQRLDACSRSSQCSS